MVALAVVGMDYREGPAALRQRLLELDGGPDAPTGELLSSGAALAVARLETCSRVEWVLSAEQPTWAAELLRSALLSRLGESKRHMHLKAGAAAASYLMRVAAGLESVAEGEPAVGRQVLRGFERAHGARRTDKVLNACWRTVGQLIHQKRGVMSASASVGVQALATAALVSRLPPHARVAIFGQGQIGKAVLRSLQTHGHFTVEAFNRATADAFRVAAQRAHAVVVCSGADRPWLQLPARDAGAWAVDLGAPEQIQAAEGWQRLRLDELLAQSAVALPTPERDALESLCAQGVEALLQTLKAAPKAKALEAIDAERRDFLDVTLPRLLEGLPAKEQKKLRSSIASFTHSVLKRTRSEL